MIADPERDANAKPSCGDRPADDVESKALDGVEGDDKVQVLVDTSFATLVAAALQPYGLCDVAASAPLESFAAIVRAGLSKGVMPSCKALDYVLLEIALHTGCAVGVPQDRGGPHG